MRMHNTDRRIRDEISGRPLRVPHPATHPAAATVHTTGNSPTSSARFAASTFPCTIP